MIRILLVDDEPLVLAELKRDLGDACADWDMSFAESGAKALELMTQSAFDVVVADDVMPGTTGAKLLNYVAEQFPDAVRILVSEQSNQGAMPQFVGPAHQYLSKPCEADVLRDAVQRAFVLRDFLTDEKLKRLVSQVQTLPMVPTVYNEVLKELRNEDPSVIKLGHLISQDLGMCAKLLQLVNSPFFGLPENVTNPGEAILYLGINTVKRLVLSIGILNGFDTKLNVISFDRLWSHCWATGALAKDLAEIESLNARAADHAFLCGLLHDVGKLVLATGLPKEYPDVVQHQRRNRVPLWQAELELLGSTHAEVGAYLLGLWGLPTPLVEAVARHHRPTADDTKSFTLTTALHVANCLHHEKDAGGVNIAPSQLDMAYLTELELQDRVEIWRKELGNSSLREAV